jgi:3-methylfumaryl-CoA hydratase
MSDRSFSEWIGRQEITEDIVTQRLVDEFFATFNPFLISESRELAPLLAHWCICPQIVDHGRLGSDGHPKKGEFLPPIPLPRRMWAGGEVVFLDNLRIGDFVRRESSIVDVKQKSGKSGSLWFVNVRHAISTERGLAITENQTLVYREPSSNAGEKPTPSVTTDADELRRTAEADPVRLFRYSAMTFNGHRIHYDRSYATDVEGYADLVVHGPLQATLLAHFGAELLKRNLRSFKFRGSAPLVVGKTFQVRGRKIDAESVACCICDADDNMTMEATLN